MSVHIAFDTPQDIKDSVFELVKLVGKEGHGTVKKGANEVTKCAERQTAYDGNHGRRCKSSRTFGSHPHDL